MEIIKKILDDIRALIAIKIFHIAFSIHKECIVDIIKKVGL